MHVAFGRVRRKSRIGADYTDYADYRIGDGGRWLGVRNRGVFAGVFSPLQKK